MGVDLLLAGLVAAVSLALAWVNARLWGHGLAVLAGVVLLLVAFISWRRDMPNLAVGFEAAWGVLLLVLGHFSWRGSRAAWAFLPASLGVLTVLSIFAVPNVRNLVAAIAEGSTTSAFGWIHAHAPMIGLVVPALFLGGTVALGRLSATARR